MTERGLWPDFSATRSPSSIGYATPAPALPPGLRDLRALLWVSIDNDDSRDLDQLSVAEAPPAGAVRILRRDRRRRRARDATARRSTSTPGTTRPRSTPRRAIFPMLPEKLSTDLTSLNDGRGARWRSSSRWSSTTDGAVARVDVYRAARAQPGQARLRRVARLARRAGADARRALAAVRRARPSSSASRTASRRSCARRATSAARSSSRRIEARAGVRRRRGRRTCAPERENRASELIEDFMIAANGVDGALPRGQGARRRCAGCVRSPERWERIVDARGRARRDAAAGARRAALERVPRRAGAKADPLRFPDLSLVVVKLLGAGEYVVELPGAARRPGTSASRCATTRTRRRRTAAIPTSSRSGCSRRRSRARRRPTAATSSTALAAHCTEQEDAADKVERQVRKSAAALLLESRIGERFDGDRHRRLRQGDLGAHLRAAGRGQARAAAARGSTSATASRVKLLAHRRRARLHRLREDGLNRVLRSRRGRRRHAVEQAKATDAERGFIDFVNDGVGEKAPHPTPLPSR